MKKRKLSEDIKYWRAERPDEWTMDEFIRAAQKLERELSDLRKDKDRLDWLTAAKTCEGKVVEVDGIKYKLTAL